MNGKTALFIGAHNDDCECAAGGTAYLLAQKGFRVMFVNIACKRLFFNRYQGETEKFSPWLDKDILKIHAHQEEQAAKILGAERTMIGERDNSLYFCCNDAVMSLKMLIEEIRPDISFIHWPMDNHSDHAEVAKTSFKALSFGAYKCEIYAFEVSPNQTMLYFYPDFYVNIVNCMTAVEKSLSQFDQPSAKGEHLIREKRICAAYRGYCSSYPYAEAFKIIKFPSGHGSVPSLPILLGEDFAWAGSDMYPWGAQYF